MSPSSDTSKYIFEHIRPDDLSSFSLIYSYTKSATVPICFTHYSHKRALVPYTGDVHQNNWCTIFIFLSGSYNFQLGTNIYSPASGDALLINNHEKYQPHFKSSQHLDYYELNFPIEFFEEVSTPDIFSVPLYNRPHSERNLISFDSDTQKIILKKLSVIESITKAERETSDILTYSYIIQIMELLYSAFLKQENETSYVRTPQKLYEAAEYINKNFLEISEVDEIAKNCNVSSSYLARIFKRHFSCSPNEYISSLRISYAKFLIQKGASLTEACYNSNFNNYTYFSSKFKELTGISPSQYKKELQSPSSSPF